MHLGNVTKTPVRLEALFKYWRGLPHQAAAIVELEQALLKAAPDLLNRNQPWFSTWSQDGKQADLGDALKMIQQFEGCHLEAYKCPAGVWTIGWGSTRYTDGRKVKQGDKINRVEADMLLRQEVDRIAERLRTTVPRWQELQDHQKSALVSFAYNLGANFYGTAGFETITAKLRDGKWDEVPEAMLLYRNPGSSFEAGLRRRREAEGRLWSKGHLRPVETQQQPAKLSPKSPFSARITPHIRIGEFALGQEARRFHHQHQIDTAAELAAFLERVRGAFGGKPVVITSGYRPPAVNRSVGGASGSEHLYSAPSVGAVDFYVHGADINAVQAWCDKNWPFSLGYGAPKGFVHLGIRAGRPRVRWDY
jgi:GH24 family phage-related lysozyme (muramidase)